MLIYNDKITYYHFKRSYYRPNRLSTTTKKRQDLRNHLNSVKIQMIKDIDKRLRGYQQIKIEN